MSVTERTWGDGQHAWIVRYSTPDRDQRGKRKRHIKTFNRKSDATAFDAQVRVDIGKGVHVAPSKSPTVIQAGKRWIETCEADGLEATSIDSYRNHLDLHISPFLGDVKLSALSVPVVRDWQAKLLRGDPAPGETEGRKRSPDMVRRATVTFGTMLADAQENGLVGQNVVRSLRRRKRKTERKPGERTSRRLQVGIDIPTPTEIDAMLGAVEGRWRPLLLVAVRCGLRASELRGLQWTDVDLKRGELHVRQRADKYNEIGLTKSASSERTIPIPPTALQALREWKLICPRVDSGDTDAEGEQIKELRYVFPSGSGKIESHANIVHRGLEPTMIAAGVSKPVLDAKGGRPKRDKKGKPMVQAKYSGLHALRHFFASWCANRKADGGLELPLKVVSERLGHSTIALTANLYTHLFPRADDSAELAAAEGRNG